MTYIDSKRQDKSAIQFHISIVYLPCVFTLDLYIREVTLTVTELKGSNSRQTV